MTSRLVLGLAGVQLATLGCGTFLTVAETSPTELTTTSTGIVVNNVTEYEVDVEHTAYSPLKLIGFEGNAGAGDEKRKKPVLRVIDQKRLMALDICRMPFSSGKLSIKLDAKQTLKEVSLTSETGLARAAEAGKGVAESLATIREAREKAESGDTAK